MIQRDDSGVKGNMIMSDIQEPKKPVDKKITKKSKSQKKLTSNQPSIRVDSASRKAKNTQRPGSSAKRMHAEDQQVEKSGASGLSKKSVQQKKARKPKTQAKHPSVTKQLRPEWKKSTASAAKNRKNLQQELPSAHAKKAAGPTHSYTQNDVASKDGFAKADPYFTREAEKYENPVPSREFITQYLEESNRPVAFRQFIEIFNIQDTEEVEGLKRRLRAMVRDGQLMMDRRNRFALVTAMDLVAGRVQGHKDGFGFLIRDEGGEDVFLPPHQMRRVFTDDRVLVRVTPQWNRQGRLEGEIVEILQHNTQKIAGRLVLESGQAFVDPDNKTIVQDIIISPQDLCGAKPGQFVVVEITEQPSLRRQPVGRIVEVLGDIVTPGMEVELAVRSHNLPFHWPDAVLQELVGVSSTIDETIYQVRQDLRDKPFVTIDGEDAKDFDDAVFCEKTSQGFRLSVAIADVGHYVKLGTALDQEAQNRGNSVYFPNRVIPMLPEQLSNDLCSLCPMVDRLVMVCEMELDNAGQLLNSQFYEGIIRSAARLTYTQVNQLLTGDSGSMETHFVLPYLQNLYELYQQLIKQRLQRGALDFETLETRIVFSDEGKIDRIIPVQRNEAHKIIEESMLLANICAAQTLATAKIPILYRNHESPEMQKLTALHEYLKALGLRLMGGKIPEAKHYSQLLRRVMTRPDAPIIQMVMLRSLQQAVYAEKNLGHFGLGYPVYCHFTSPIRRYPDLIVHRALKHWIHHHSTKSYPMDVKKLTELGGHFSATERRADRATREATDWLKCEYMRHRLGEVFDGVISSITSFGAFVMLKDIYIEGLLHITALPGDYYVYEEHQHLLRGRRGGRIFKLGDPIRVLVANVNLDERKIDFDWGNE